MSPDSKQQGSQSPSRLYVNHAGTSYPKPDEVLQAIASALALDPADYPRLFQSARATVAAHLGADPERILFCSSCTQALDVAFSELSLSAGDRIVTSQLEHSALTRPVESLVRHRGVQRSVIPYRAGCAFDLEQLRTELRAGGVRCVAMSAASNVSGEVLPVAEAAALAHEHGALLLVDAAQTFGLLPDTVVELDCDLLVFAGHKNPLGPQGIGGLWVRETVALGDAAACEVPTPGAAPGPGCLASMPGYCEVGGVNMAGLAGLAAGLSAFGEQRAERMEGARHMARQVAAWARSESRLQVIGHHGGPQTAVVSLLPRAVSLSEAERFLSQDCGIQGRAGAHCAPEALDAVGAPEGTLRISFGALSPADSAQRVQAALAGLCALAR